MVIEIEKDRISLVHAHFDSPGHAEVLQYSIHPLEGNVALGGIAKDFALERYQCATLLRPEDYQLLLVDAPIPEMRVHLWTALAVSLPLGVITIFLMSLALKARRNKVVTGREGLIGETGVAQTALSPLGKVFVHGELWDAVSSAEVAAGQSVVVQRVDGLRLWVDPVGSVQSVHASVAL